MNQQRRIKFINTVSKVSKYDIGDRIREFRESLKMSQAKFGKLIGFGNSTISRYESGQFQNINPNLLYGIVRYGGSLNKIFS